MLYEIESGRLCGPTFRVWRKTRILRTTAKVLAPNVFAVMAAVAFDLKAVIVVEFAVVNDCIARLFSLVFIGFVCVPVVVVALVVFASLMVVVVFALVGLVLGL